MVKYVFCAISPDADRDAITAARLQLGLAYLRLGEQASCLNNHNAESCILPLSGGGIHLDQVGSSHAFQTYLDLLAATMDLVATQVDAQAKAGKTLDETRAAIDWSPVEQRFTGGDPLLAFLFNVWFKTPIVEAQYNLSTGQDNESLEAPPVQ